MRTLILAAWLTVVWGSIASALALGGATGTLILKTLVAWYILAAGLLVWRFRIGTFGRKWVPYAVVHQWRSLPPIRGLQRRGPIGRILATIFVAILALHVPFFILLGLGSSLFESLYTRWSPSHSR